MLIFKIFIIDLPLKDHDCFFLSNLLGFVVLCVRYKIWEAKIDYLHVVLPVNLQCAGLKIYKKKSILNFKTKKKKKRTPYKIVGKKGPYKIVGKRTIKN